MKKVPMELRKALYECCKEKDETDVDELLKSAFPSTENSDKKPKQQKRGLL